MRLTHASAVITTLIITLQLSQTKNITNPCDTCACAVKSDASCENCFKVELDSLKQWKRRRRLCRVERSFDSDMLDVPNMVGSSSRHQPVLATSLSTVAKFKQQWPVELWRQYLFTDDYLMLINPHWLKFPPPHAAVNYSMGGLYILMMLAGGTGNGLVLVMYLRCRSLRTPGNILVASLALSDFLMLAKTPVFIFNSFNLGPALGKTGCLIYGFLGGLTGCTSIATLAAIALDRYWAIARPLEGLGTLTAVRARVLAVAAWLYAALFASVPAFDIGYGRYVPEGYLTSCSFDYLTDEVKPRYFIFVFFCAAWVTPFATITFCYINILRVVICKRNVSTTSSNDHRLSTRHVKEQAKKKAELKLAVLVIAVIALFFVSWTPYAIIALMGIFGNRDLITPTSSMIPALFCKTAACINPFVYIITHPKFRKEIKNLFSKGKSRQYGGTMRTIGYTTDATTYHRPSKDSSETDVEVVEMKDIPFQGEGKRGKEGVKSVSGRLSEREGSQRSINESMKSYEGDVVSPPSWFRQPQFSKKRSFHRRSTRSVVSFDTNAVL
ncbi:opsin Rh3 [Plutella xylostella]|uniref:opsin Rh3 n=1 Tax=Plutella xylostella TaxID=51655 RepID=UPI002032B93A|nr:opsin Rh3 [Plutella xylostella]